MNEYGLPAHQSSQIKLGNGYHISGIYPFYRATAVWPRYILHHQADGTKYRQSNHSLVETIREQQPFGYYTQYTAKPINHKAMSYVLGLEEGELDYGSDIESPQALPVNEDDTSRQAPNPFP